jgi:hypothetical protein
LSSDIVSGERTPLGMFTMIASDLAPSKMEASPRGGAEVDFEALYLNRYSGGR